MTPRKLTALVMGAALSLSASFYGCGTQSEVVSGSGPEGDASDDGSASFGDASSSETGANGDAGVVGNDGGWFGSDGSTCRPLGQRCVSGAACCSGQCTSGSCQPPSCVSDGLACATNGQCCSGTCTNGACVALNDQCKTLGNACTSGSQCCSKVCNGGICAQPSYCGQIGDICATSTDCCGGICSKAGTASFGVCDQPSSGGAQCSMLDGTVCAGSPGTLADGGIVMNDGGIPQCGGSCCSRACAPWGPTGVLVCQPASGCRPVGELCSSDSDCCGGPGVPGPLPSSGKTVKCNIVAPNVVGVCENPQGCKPNGDICRLQTNSCSATDNCCAGNVQQFDTCKQDILGIPRCANAVCAAASNGCATSADCCNNVPCVPNPGYTPGGNAPEFVCGATACVPTSGLCTTSADCCPGNICSIPPGGTKGTCSPLTPPSGADGGGGGDSGASDGSPGDTDAGAPCSLYGQTCTTAADCCNGVSCNGGRCYILQ